MSGVVVQQVGKLLHKKLAVVQLCATNKIEANISKCKRLVKLAKTNGAHFVALPEAFDFIGTPGTNEYLTLSSTLDDSLMKRYCHIAKENQVWLSLGGFHEKPSIDAKKIMNTHCIVNSDGEIVCSYRKMHLFDVDYDGGFKESASTIAGDKIVIVKNTPVGTIGVTTCYDLRFPEMYTCFQENGVDVILIPSAFMPTTGKAHWEVLLRARAIENQCYVAAAAQVGQHNPSRSSYGHSMVVDPWGKVVIDLENENPAIGIAGIDYEKIEKVRQKMPLVNHRKATSSAVHVSHGSNTLQIVNE